MVLRTIIYHPFVWPCCQWEGGRLLILPTELPSQAAWLPGLQRELLEAHSNVTGRPIGDELGPKDVLVLRLFHDSLQPEHQVKTGMEPLPDYDDTMELIREFGPRVRGIMVGNQMAAELSYRHMYATWRGDPAPNLEAIADFVRRVGTTLREAGATPWFAAMDWDMLQDAYCGERRMLTALNEVGATNWIACGYSCVPGAYIKPELPEYGEHLRIQRERIEKGHDPGTADDFPVLRDYLQAGSFWSGLCGAVGIRAGNIERLSEYGFKGFATKLHEHDIWRLAEELGEKWWE